MSFSSKTVLVLRHFFLEAISTRLDPGANGINTPTQPNYGDNTYEEEDTPHGTTYNGSEVGSLTLRHRGRGDRKSCRDWVAWLLREFGF